MAFGLAGGAGAVVGPLLDVADRGGMPGVVAGGSVPSDPPPAPNALPSTHPERLTAKAAMPTIALENRIAVPARRCREKRTALGLHRTDDACGAGFAGKGRPASERCSKRGWRVASGR